MTLMATAPWDDHHQLPARLRGSACRPKAASSCDSSPRRSGTQSAFRPNDSATTLEAINTHLIGCTYVHLLASFHLTIEQEIMRLMSLAVLLITMSASAESQAPPPRFSVLAGANVSSIAGTDANGLDSRKAALFGAGLVAPLDSAWAVDLMITYSMKGAASSDQSSTAALKRGYVEAPLLLRFTVPAAGEVKPFFTGGAAVAYETGCDIEAKGGGTTVSMTCKEAAQQFGDGVTEFQKVDAGVVVGGGLAFGVGSRVMTLGVRYTIGLVDTETDADSRNRVLSFVGTFEWPLRK